MRQIELAIPLPFRAPLELKLARSAEFYHACVLVTVADIKRAITQHRDISGQIEVRVIIARHTRLTEREQHLALRRAFEDLMQSHIGEPEIALMIDREPVRHDEAVLTPSAKQLATRAIQQTHRRSNNRFRRKRIRPRPPTAMEDEDTVLRIDANTGAKTELMPLGQLRPVGHDFMLRLGESCCCEQEDGASESHAHFSFDTFTSSTCADLFTASVIMRLVGCAMPSLLKEPISCPSMRTDI